MWPLRQARPLASLALLVSITLSLPAVPAHAQGPVVTAGPYKTSFGVRCEDGRCSLAADLGAGEVDVPVPAETPLKFDLPTGAPGFLSGAAIEIADKLTISLPVGEIQMPEGAFAVELDEAGEIHTLHGSADSLLPNLTLPYNIRIGGDFATEFGYDFGSELGNLSSLFDPEQRYFFLRVGDGFTFDTSLADDSGRSKPITLAVPQNESATLVIDPDSQVLYLDGRFNVSQVLRLVSLAAALGIDVQQVPVLTGLVLPLRSTVGVAALLARDIGSSFVEFHGDLGIEGGPLGQLLRVGAEPLSLDSAVRIDRSGIKLQGAAGTELVPEHLLTSGGTVEFFIPFGPLQDAYVRIGGELSVPVAGLARAGEVQLGGRRPEGNGLAAQGPAWWGQAATWIGDTASGTASGVAGGAQASLDALQGVIDLARGGLGAAAGGTSTAAGAVAGGASSAAGAVTGGASAAAGIVAGGAAAAADAVVDGASTAAGAVAGGASSVAGVVVDGAATAAGAVAAGASSAAGVVAGGASSAAGAAGDVAGAAWSGTTSGLGCGVSKAQQLWCRTTGLCEVTEDPCAAEDGD